MKSLSILLVATLFVTTFGGFINWKSKSKDSRKPRTKSPTKYPTRRPTRRTPAPITPSPTYYIPTNAELCACYELNLVCAPAIINNEICYYYMIESNKNYFDYCNPISTLTLSTDNDCGLTAADISEMTMDYAPKCYGFDPSYAGGIKLTLDQAPSSGNRRPPSDDYMVFSMCFDVDKVSGFNQNGQIEYATSNGVHYSCDTPDLPDFCGTPAPTTRRPTDNPTPKPTTAVPTTAVPTTADPTTSDPTTGSPTTAAPTTSHPTTSVPTTSEPTTSSPTTSEPTTSDPTTAPTTSEPTTASPTTASPTTSDPTTSAPTATPTTSDPTTSNPTTASPTTADPTTAQPTGSPTFKLCNTTDAYNIAFLLDESGSVSDDEWDVMIEFIRRLITFDVSGDSYVALYEYASLSGFQRFLDFTGPRSRRLDGIERGLDGNRYTRAGFTETWDAVNRVLDDFYTLTTTATPRNQGRGNILFLITDGNPTDLAGNPNSTQYISDEYNTCPYIQTRLEQQFPDNYIDVAVIIIDPDQSLDSTKVECLDYYNNQADVIPINSFDSAAFNAIEGRIRDKICTEGLVGGTQAGPGTRRWRYPDGRFGLGPVPRAPGPGVSCSNDPGSANPCDPDTTASP